MRHHLQPKKTKSIIHLYNSKKMFYLFFITNKRSALVLKVGMAYRRKMANALPVTTRDLRYISIWQYIDIVIKYRIVILCSMNIEVSKWLCSGE